MHLSKEYHASLQVASGLRNSLATAQLTKAARQMEEPATAEQQD